VGSKVHVSSQWPRFLRRIMIIIFLLTFSAFGKQSNAPAAYLNFVTESVKSTFECLTYDCKTGSTPPILNILQMKCEAEKEKLGCSKITDKDPGEAKYIRSCTFKKICERKLMPSLGLDVVACLRGAAAVYHDYADMLQGISYKIEEHQDELKNCTSLSCKRSLAKGTPEFANMDDATFLKYNATYIENRAGAYRAYISHYNRVQAAGKYFDDDTGRKRFYENQDRRDVSLTAIEVDYIKLGRKAIESAGIKLDCYDDHAYAEILCHGILTSVAPGLVFKGGITAIRSVAALAATTLERRGFITGQKYFFESERTLHRQLFTEKHFFKRFTTKEQNALFIQAADESVPKPGRVFFRIENGVLKFLNSNIGDKVLVTSINNKYNEILFRKLAELKKKYPDMDFPPYQGFKEVEFMAVTRNGSPIPDTLMRDVDNMFQDANKELKRHLDVNSILRASDQPENWFRAGVGRTGDMANAAARESRNDLGHNVLVNFDDPAILAKLENSVAEGRRLTERLSRTFAGSEMISVRDGIPTLNSDVMGLVRKYSDAAELRHALSTKYPNQNISLEQANQIRQLYDIQDRFSPPVRFAEREIASFSSTHGTEVGIDFVNAGGANAEGQLRALLGSRNGTEMMARSRTEFGIATEELNRKKDQFNSIAQDLARAYNQNLPPGGRPMQVTVAKSGDDGVATFSEILTQDQKDWIAKEWVRRESEKGKASSSARISIPNEAVKNVIQKNLLAGHGEDIEKALRSKLLGNISNKSLDQVLVKIEMKGHTSGTGYVNLSIASAKGKSLTSDQILEIKRYFEKAVKQVNKSDSKKTMRYGAGEIRIISN
jgi:hypothetical protein